MGDSPKQSDSNKSSQKKIYNRSSHKLVTKSPSNNQNVRGELNREAVSEIARKLKKPEDTDLSTIRQYLLELRADIASAENPSTDNKNTAKFRNKQKEKVSYFSGSFLDSLTTNTVKQSTTRSNSNNKSIDNKLACQEIEYLLLLTRPDEKPLSSEINDIIRSRIEELTHAVENEEKIQKHLKSILNTQDSSIVSDKKLVIRLHKCLLESAAKLDNLRFHLNKFDRLCSSRNGYSDFLAGNFISSTEELAIISHFLKINKNIVFGFKKLIKMSKKHDTSKTVIKEMNNDLIDYYQRCSILEESIKNIKSCLKYSEQELSIESLERMANLKSRPRFSGNLVIQITKIEDIPQRTNEKFEKITSKKKFEFWRVFSSNKAKKNDVFLKFTPIGKEGVRTQWKTLDTLDNKFNTSTTLSLSSNLFIEFSVYRADGLVALAYVNLEDATLFNELTMKIQLYPKGEISANFYLNDAKMVISPSKKLLVRPKRIVNRIKRKTYEQISSGDSCPNLTALSKIFNNDHSQTSIEISHSSCDMNESKFDSEEEGFAFLFKKYQGTIKHHSSSLILSLQTVNGYKFIKMINQGHFGKIFLVEKEKASQQPQESPNNLLLESTQPANEKFAMKSLSKYSVLINSDADAAFIERDILKLCRGFPFIVQMHETFTDRYHLYFIMEHCERGDLIHLIKSEKLNIEQIVYYSAAMVSALDFLHNNKVIYRDLKLDNVCIKESGVPKLIDFGLSKTDISLGQKTDTFCGTYFYLPPEMLCGPSYCHTLDYWQLGTMMYMMYFNVHPFYAEKDDHLVKKILETEPVYYDSLYPDYNDLLVCLLKKDPTQRLGSLECGGIDRVCNHPFFKNINWNQLKAGEVASPKLPNLEELKNANNEEVEAGPFPLALPSVEKAEKTGLVLSKNHEFKGFSQKFR